jgi:hypothetical protein
VLLFLIDFEKQAIFRQIKKMGGKLAWEVASVLQKEGDCPR